MALIQVDDTNFQKISNFTNVPADQIRDTDLITGLHNGGNANFRIYDIVSKVMEGIDIDPGQDPGYDPGGELGEQVTYSVIIDHSKSDPAKMCTYADDALNFRGKNGWENLKNKPIFKKIKPCVLKNGEVLYYLNPDNYAKKEDGTNADISTLGNDVMVEFGERMGYKFDWLDENRLKVSVTNRPNAAGFWYDAFSYSGYNDCDKIYVGAYCGYITSGRMYSSYNKTPSYSSFLNARNTARAKGNGYEMWWYGAVLLIQSLFVIAYCNLDSQTTIGIGYKGGSNLRTTGQTNSFGMCSGRQDSAYGVKCFGIEDLWGNMREWVEGIQTDSTNQVMLYNFGGSSEWINMGNGGKSSYYYGFQSKPRGGRLGFLGIESDGAGSSKYCDRYAVAPTSVLAWGFTDFSSTPPLNYMGIFQLYISIPIADISLAGNNFIGSRLMYFHRG